MSTGFSPGFQVNQRDYGTGICPRPECGVKFVCLVKGQEHCGKIPCKQWCRNRRLRAKSKVAK